MDKKITTLEELHKCRLARKSVIIPTMLSPRPMPAAFVWRMQGGEIDRMIRRGMYIYQKGTKKSWETAPWKQNRCVCGKKIHRFETACGPCTMEFNHQDAEDSHKEDETEIGDE